MNENFFKLSILGEATLVLHFQYCILLNKRTTSQYFNMFIMKWQYLAFNSHLYRFLYTFYTYLVHSFLSGLTRSLRTGFDELGWIRNPDP